MSERCTKAGDVVAICIKRVFCTRKKQWEEKRGKVKWKNVGTLSSSHQGKSGFSCWITIAKKQQKQQQQLLFSHFHSHFPAQQSALMADSVSLYDYPSHRNTSHHHPIAVSRVKSSSIYPGFNDKRLDKDMYEIIMYAIREQWIVSTV